MNDYKDDYCKSTITDLSKHEKNTWNKIIILLQEKIKTCFKFQNKEANFF